MKLNKLNKLAVLLSSLVIENSAVEAANNFNEDKILNIAVSPHAMVIIGKFFENTDDLKKVVMTNKAYKDLFDKYLYNPVTLRSKEEREFFKNMITYYYYGYGEVDVILQQAILEDPRIKKVYYLHRPSVGLEGDRYTHQYIEYNKDMVDNELVTEETKGKERRTLKITNVKEFPAGITYIGAQSFYWCCNLASVTIPDSVTRLDDEAFRRCGQL